jgi:hypothetical protein
VKFNLSGDGNGRERVNIAETQTCIFLETEVQQEAFIS